MEFGEYLRMKMKVTYPTLSILVYTLLILGSWGCNPFKTIEYRGISDWDIKPKSFLESGLSAKIHVFNPNNYKITVKRIEANIEVNGSNWGQYKLDSSFVMPANGEFALPIGLNVKNAQILSGALNLVSGNGVPYQLTGKIKGTYRNLTTEVPFVQKGFLSEDDIKL